MLGPLRSSRASSLGQAGVFLFVWTLPHLIDGSQRIFQQLPQQKIQTASQEPSNFNQTTAGYSAQLNSSVQQSEAWIDELIGVCAGSFFLLLCTVVVYAVRKEERDRLARLQADWPAQPKPIQSLELTFSEGLNATGHDVPSIVVFSRGVQVVINLQRCSQGYPLTAEIADTDLSDESTPSALVSRPRKAPSMMVIHLRSGGGAESVRLPSGVLTSLNGPEALVKYRVPQDQLSPETALRQPGETAVPDKGKLTAANFRLEACRPMEGIVPSAKAL